MKAAASGVWLMASAGLIALLGGCTGRSSDENQVTNGANAVTDSIVPQLPIPESPLDREQLLLDALQAASDFATGTDGVGHQKELDGKEFEFRIPIGCDGPLKDGFTAASGWTFDEATRALKVRATPTLSEEQSAVKAIADESFEAAEGFWVPRPWLLSAACPASPPPATEEAEQSEEDGPPKAKTQTKPAAKADGKSAPKAMKPAPVEKTVVEENRTVGIAQFFTATEPRTARRSGRPYELTKRLEKDAKPGGVELVLSGRLKALPDGRVIACTASQSGGRPTCVISVQFGTVSIERTDTHEVLAHWGTG